MIKYIIYTIALSLFGACTPKETNNIWHQYTTRDSIPKALQQKLSKNEVFTIANPNEKFNATDMLIDSLPNKKLIFVARNQQLYQLVYLQGGFGKYYVVIQCRIEDNLVYDFKKGETLQKIQNHTDVQKLLANNTLSLK